MLTGCSQPSEGQVGVTRRHGLHIDELFEVINALTYSSLSVNEDVFLGCDRGRRLHPQDSSEEQGRSGVQSPNAGHAERRRAPPASAR